MKFCILVAVLAFVAPSYGWSLYNRRVQSLDFQRVMYAAGGTLQCDLCEMVVTDVQSLLQGKEPEIQNLFDSLCADLPKQYQDNCTSIVNTYLPILFALIDDMTPAEVCELLTLCTSDVNLPENDPSQSMRAFANYFLRRVSSLRSIRERRINYFRQLVGENYLCEACEDTIGFIHEAVACNYTWEAVAEFFEPFCQICPVPDQCTNFFLSLPGDVNDFANKYLDPVQDCEIFGFCPAEEEEEEEIEEDEEEETEEEVEEVDVQIVEAMIPVQSQPRRINVGVNSRVHLSKGKGKNSYKLPKISSRKMQKLGRRGMDEFRRRMTRAILVSVGGQEDVNQVPYDINGDQQVEEVPAQAKCEICRYFSSAAEGVLQYNEADITEGLSIVFDDICNALPDQWRTECQTQIEDVLPDIIYQALLKLMNPDYLCVQTIGICSQ
ncbi:Prosaposin [Holothuria leucospilota]|uniref:Prosaposin n=1 Tax=Holothuria leucospilota TaxID=206669 RepID=A0A9Q0YI44_HOLLE|nr:Prosaposin [Holothuria leucospilota]